MPGFYLGWKWTLRAGWVASLWRKCRTMSFFFNWAVSSAKIRYPLQPTGWE
ncbi:hypothetical protein MIZ01_0368 [Sideroxyarcus emersonii]|uniref:Uncharacterized protein n=1 Tax=Sideroxyarcus emersonii TaxID=2764705 RepID=A0AAN2BXZ0_9PROT|nr:hypothetical protein MIZ01_0368 [Sideroxyarcus emersonii]